ncbi:putative ribonuclease H-like domain-containing protein [Tanacetum coccineum]
MSAKDKSGLGYGDQIHEGVLSYENEVFQSVFDSRSSDVEDSLMYDRFVKVEGMHAVPSLMTGNYMSPKSNFGIDESNFTYGPKQSKTSESVANTSDFNSCETNSSVETLESVPEPVVVEPKVVSQPKVWSDAPIIEEYESESDDDFSHLIRDCDFHEKRMAKQVELNKKKGKGTGQGETKPVWNNVQRLNYQNKFVPKAVLTKTGIFPVNTARQNLSSQAAATSTARKINIARPIVNKIRPRSNLYKSHTPIRKPSNRTTAPKANFANHKVNTVGNKIVSVVGGNRETTVKASACCNWRSKRYYWNKVSKYNSGSNSSKNDDPQKALKNKGIVDSGFSRHMTRNKAYLVEYQNYNGGLVDFGGSKGQITGKGKIITRKLDFEDVYFVKELKKFNLFFVSQMCDKKNRVLFTDSEFPTGRYVVPTGRVIATDSVIVATSGYVVPAAYDISPGRVKEYEYWAMKMEYWIMNTDHNLWNIVLQGNSRKRTGRDPRGNIMILPPVTMEEQIAVQREIKARTILLQSLPEDHMADFHHLDDAKDIWLAVKARFGGNEESKKMRKSMLKQEFADFKISESEGLHKGYDRFQKVLSQLNQMQARPDNEDCNMKFLRALPPSWSQVAITLKTKGGLDFLSFDDLYNKLRTLEIDVKGGSSYDSRVPAAPTHSAFISAASTNSKWSTADSKGQPSTISYTTTSSSADASGNVLENVLHSFVAESDPQQQITYEDFDQIGKLDLEELDIKWQMAMLSVRINRFEKKAGRKFKFNNKDAARFDKKKVRCYQCSELGHFARECTGKKVDSKTRYSQFKIKELDKSEEPKALVSVDSMLNWSDHESEDMEKGASEVYGMIAGYGDDTIIPTGDAADGGGRDSFSADGVSVAAGRMKEVLWIEAIRIFLAFSSYMGFIVYQMDVKSAFLYGIINEEVYVSQPPSFVDPEFPKKVYKVVKALYGLHQAPRAWYATLSTFLLKSGYRRGTIDKNLFIKKDKNDIMLVQVYVDDIIFCSTKRSWCDEFEALMKSRFQMSSMGELTFFLGLQVKQKEDGIFISQDKYVAKILKKFDFANVKTASTPIETQKPLTKDEEATDVDVHLYRSMIGSLMYLTTSRPDIMFAVIACSRFQITPKTSHLNAVKRIFRYLKGKPKLGLWYPKVSSFNLEAYLDSDYAGANLDRKSTIGGCQFLGRRLISWQCKKHNCGYFYYRGRICCCCQLLWNPVFHSKTKHIEIRNYFIIDAYEKKHIQVLKIHTNDNVADLLTKAFDVSIHQELASPEQTTSALAIPGQTTTGKESLNPLMADSLPKTIQSNDPPLSRGYTLGSGEDSLKLMELMEFVQNSTASTNVHGEVKLTASIDGQAKTITEASLRRYLKLEDDGGITSLPNTEIFEQLALMGYTIDSNKLTFQKSNFSPPWRFFIHTILHCLSPKKTSWEQFSSNIATAIICLSTNRIFNFSKFIFNAMKVFSNMKRVTRCYSGDTIPLFPSMITAPETSPSRITSSPSLSPLQYTIHPHDTEIQEKISDDTEVLIEEEEPTELVEDQESGEKGNKRSAKKKKDKGKAIVIEDESVQKKSKKQVQEERLGYEEAIRLQEHIDDEERKRIARDVEIAKQLQEEYVKVGKKEVVSEVDIAHVIDWDDPALGVAISDPTQNPT